MTKGKHRLILAKSFLLAFSALTLLSVSGCKDTTDDSALTPTSTPAPTKTSWSFAVLCDSRASYAGDPAGTTGPYYADDGTSPYFKNIASALAREKGIDFVLFPGDLVRGKKPSLSQSVMSADLTQWMAYMKPVIDAGMPIYYVRGNHDMNAVTDPVSTGSGFADALSIWKSIVPMPGNSVNPITIDNNGTQNGVSYSFTHKGALILAVDEYSDGTLTYDKAFVNSQLAKPATTKIVMAHQPLWNYKADETGPAGLADDLQAGKADIFFSGHVHSYQRISEAGYRFQEVIVGTGGAPQDDPTVGPSGNGYVADPKLTVNSYTGGANANARMGYLVVTVFSDGTLSSVMKVLDVPGSPTSTVYSTDAAFVTAK